MESAEGSRQELMRELRALFAKAKMPSSPALASRIIELINDSRSSATDFGAAIRTDAALSTRLLKTANSVQFAQRNPVTTIERAVTVVGLARVKTISLGFQLVGHLDRLGGAPFDMKTFWQQSLLRACLAKATAHHAITDRKEEAFLVGLLQDCGILLLAQILGAGYTGLYRSDLSPSAFYAVEKKEFGHTHVNAMAALADEWQLPRLIADPIERHHRRPHHGAVRSELDLLCAVAYFVGGLCFSAERKVDAQERGLREFGEAFLGLDEAAWEATQALAVEEYEQISTMYGDVLPEDIDVTDLLSEANHYLTSVADDADRRFLDVQKERDAIHSQQERLEHALSEYRERAALDPLTNVLNRGALSDVVRGAMEQLRDDHMPISILFIDIDNFKRLNDNYGHRVGDGVLKTVAGVLGSAAGHRGAVGRYGGEEFVVLLHDVDPHTARDLAHEMVERVRAIDARAFGFDGPVTCSLGGIWCDDAGARSAEELIAAADELMYKAKRGGKDRCCFSTPANHPESEIDQTGSHAVSRGRAPDAPGASQSGDIPIGEFYSLAVQLNADEPKEFIGIRKEERKKIVLPCEVHYFTGTGTQMRFEPGATRNISTGGIAVLIARAMVRGEAVEVMLDKGTSKLFIAGLASFCRHLRGRIHEVGIQFVEQSVGPIISGDIPHALQEHDWVAQALAAKCGGKLGEEVATS